MKRTFFTPLSAAFFVALTGFLFFVTSCSKENSASTDADKAEKAAAFDVASRGVQAQLLYSNMMTAFLQAGASGALARESCPSFSLVPDDSVTYPKTATIDFGASCMNALGLPVSGKMVAVITAPPMYPGATITITEDSFYVAGVHMEGTMTLQNNSTLAGLSFAMTVENGKITWPESDTSLEFSASETVTQVAGMTTPSDMLDDTYQITGSSSISWGGMVFNANIVDPLMKNFICSDFLSGSISVEVPEHTASIDFGEGDCDHTATVTVDGDTQEISLPH